MKDLTELLCEALNIYCFDNIYNKPQNELRVNVKPHMVVPRSINGGLDTGSGNVIPLPTEHEAYYVYALHRDTVHGLKDMRMSKFTWVDAVDLCNEYQVLMHVYLPNGKMLHKGSTFIYWRCDESVAYLAVKKKALTTLGEHEDAKSIYITLYRDSNFVNDMIVHSYRLPELDDSYTARQKVWNVLFEAAKNGTYYDVYVDGYEISVSDIGDIPLGAYLDVVIDHNTVIDFTVNLSDTEKNVGFFSEMDSTYKQLIHIPKEYNGDQLLLTHNTMEFHVRSNETNKGIYLHRCAPRSVTQITHNDVGIPMFILDAIRDTLGTQDVTVKVAVRQHDNLNYLIRDKNYIDLLYSDHHDDAAIVNHLLGKTSSKLSFWKAEHLEQSKYVEMMFSVPDMFTPQNVWAYVEGLGYYHTVSVLCGRMIVTTITDWFTGSLDFAKPYLFSNEDTYPIVYLNDFKVPWDGVTVTNQTNDKVTIGFTDEVPWKIGDSMVVELCVSGPNNIYRFTPVQGASKIVVPYENIRILKSLELEKEVVSYERTDKVAYPVFDDLIGNVVFTNVSGGVELNFGPLMYGTEFIIQNDQTTYKYSKQLDSDMLKGSPLVLDLEFRDDSQKTVPIQNTSHIVGFVNGRYLTPNVDYHILHNTDDDGNLVITQFVLQNMKYLKESVNTLEVLVSGAKVDNETYGFVVDNRADTDLDDVTIFFDTLSTFHVDGRLEPIPEYRGAYFNLEPDKYPDGVPFSVRTAIPAQVKDFVDKHHNNDDTERIGILNEYFYGKMDNRPPIVVLSMWSHPIYSTHMATIVRDIVNGTFGNIAIDPDISKLKLSLSKYQKFYDHDVCQQSKFNTTFLDCYPHYKQYEGIDPVMRKYINDLVEAVMPKDKIGSGFNVY